MYLYLLSTYCVFFLKHIGSVFLKFNAFAKKYLLPKWKIIKWRAWLQSKIRKKFSATIDKNLGSTQIKYVYLLVECPSLVSDRYTFKYPQFPQVRSVCCCVTIFQRNFLKTTQEHFTKLQHLELLRSKLIQSWYNDFSSIFSFINTENNT